MLLQNAHRGWRYSGCAKQSLFPLFFPLGLVTFRLFCRNAESLVMVFFSLLLCSKVSTLYQLSQAEVVAPHFKLFKFPLGAAAILTHSYWFTRQYFLLLYFNVCFEYMTKFLLIQLALQIKFLLKRKMLIHLVTSMGQK